MSLFDFNEPCGFWLSHLFRKLSTQLTNPSKPSCAEPLLACFGPAWGDDEQEVSGLTGELPRRSTRKSFSPTATSAVIWTWFLGDGTCSTLPDTKGNHAGSLLVDAHEAGGEKGTSGYGSTTYSYNLDYHSLKVRTFTTRLEGTYYERQPFVCGLKWPAGSMVLATNIAALPSLQYLPNHHKFINHRFCERRLSKFWRYCSSIWSIPVDDFSGETWRHIWHKGRRFPLGYLFSNGRRLEYMRDWWGSPLIVFIRRSAVFRQDGDTVCI